MASYKRAFLCFCVASALHTVTMTSYSGSLRAVDEGADRAIQALLILAFGSYTAAAFMSSFLAFAVVESTNSTKTCMWTVASLLGFLGGVCTLVGLVLFHTELDERAKERGSPIPYTATVYSTGAAVAVVGGVFSCILARQPSAATTDQQPPIQYHDGLYNPGFLASSAVPPAADLYSGPSQHQGEFHQPDVYQNGRAGLPTPSHPMNLQQYVYLEPPESQGYVTNRDGQEDRIPNNETYAVTTRNLAPASGYYQESANPEKVPRDQRESETGYRETHAGSQGQGERQGPYPERGERYEYYGLEEGHTGAGRDGRKVGQYDVNAAGDVAVSSPI